MGRRGIFLPCQPMGMMVEVGVVKVDVEQVFLFMFESSINKELSLT